MQRLRSEHDIDVRRARHDGRALLAGDAAADAYDQARSRLLQVLDPAQIVKYFFLRFFPHRAGIEHVDVGFVRVGGGFHAFGGAQHVGHLGRVVLVHLAAEGLDVEL